MTLEARKNQLAQLIFNANEHLIAKIESSIEDNLLSGRTDLAEEQLKEGNTKSHLEAKQELNKWLKK